jgi:hypothetical protein
MLTEFLHYNDKRKRLLLSSRYLVYQILKCLCALMIPSTLCGETFLPDSSELTGWKMDGEPYQYSANNLYDYINGAADFFIGYGFVSLIGASYSSEFATEDSITVDIYDLGEKLNAFGVFQARRNPELPSLEIGAASFGDDDYACFYKDRYYVEIYPLIKHENRKDQHLVMARKVEERIPGDTGPPGELSYFPEAGRNPGSEKYIKGGILGHAFLDRGLVSEYTIEAETVSAFVAFFCSKEEAGSSISKHQDYLHASKSTCEPLEGFGDRGFVSKEPYHKNILVVQEGALIIGVYDLSAHEKGLDLLQGILTRAKHRTK